MTKKAFNEIAQSGTKLLHITSDVMVEDESKICFEHKWGESKFLKLWQLGAMLTNTKAAQNIDLVSIALPKSSQIGEIFKSKGIKHVLCFKTKEIKQTTDDQEK